MSIISLQRRMLRIDHGRDRSRRFIEQMTDAELEAAIEEVVRTMDPSLADQLRDASEEERARLHKQIAAGEMP